MLLDSLIGGIGGIVSRSAVAPIELNRIQTKLFYTKCHYERCL